MAVCTIIKPSQEVTNENKNTYTNSFLSSLQFIGSDAKLLRK